MHNSTEIMKFTMKIVDTFLIQKTENILANLQIVLKLLEKLKELIPNLMVVRLVQTVVIQLKLLSNFQLNYNN